MEFKRRLHRTKKNTTNNQGGLKMLRLTVFKEGTQHQPKTLLTELKRR